MRATHPTRGIPPFGNPRLVYESVFVLGEDGSNSKYDKVNKVLTLYILRRTPVLILRLSVVVSTLNVRTQFSTC